ncbi:uncharacterized protein ACIBXB_000334 [Morphnus guianensis]
MGRPVGSSREVSRCEDARRDVQRGQLPCCALPPTPRVHVCTLQPLVAASGSLMCSHSLELLMDAPFPPHPCAPCSQGASNNSRVSLLSLPGRLISTVDLVKNLELWFLCSDPGKSVTGCCAGPSQRLASGVWCRSPCCCCCCCCSRAIVAVLVGTQWLGLCGGQCFCLAAGSLSLRILPAFLGQASPPLLSANAGTARSRARLRRNLSTLLQREAVFSHPSHANGHWPGPSPRAGYGTCTAPWSLFPLHRFGSAVPVHPGGVGHRRRGAQAVGTVACRQQPHACSLVFCSSGCSQQQRRRQQSCWGPPQSHLLLGPPPQTQRGQIPSGSASGTDSPFPAGLPRPSTPSPSQQLRLDPSSCLQKLKPLAFPVQTFLINKWRHHATSPQVTQRWVRGRDGHDHPAPDPLAGRQPCLCLNSRLEAKKMDMELTKLCHGGN